MSKESDFLTKYLPIAVAVGEDFSLNPAVILAQAALEGNFGLSHGAKYRKNHFGITASGSTNQYWDGTKTQSSSSGLWFRVYKTDYDGFADFARLITQKYKRCASKSYNTNEYAKCIAQSPYISEANGDNRQQYEATVETYARKFQPIVDNFIKQKTIKKKIFIATVIVSLLVIGGYFTYYFIKQNKK